MKSRKSRGEKEAVRGELAAVFNLLSDFQVVEGRLLCSGLWRQANENKSLIEGRDWDFGCEVLVSLFLSPTRRV